MKGSLKLCIYFNFAFVFNSYYENIGKRVIRSNRGNLSRPSVSQVYDYRHYVTQHMEALILEKGVEAEWAFAFQVGVHHEKQHQELLLTDIKYILGNNPLLPSYSNQIKEHPVLPNTSEVTWVEIPKGRYTIGHSNPNIFCYDNELNAHEVWLQDYKLATTLVSNKDYIEFIEADILDCDLGSIKFDVIVSNPPYVRELEKEMMSANVLNHEPHLALFVKDDDALLFYKEITELSKTILKPCGQLYFEINESLGERTKELLDNNDFNSIELKRDIFDKDRMIKAIKR